MTSISLIFDWLEQINEFYLLTETRQLRTEVLSPLLERTGFLRKKICELSFMLLEAVC